eukprot:CAMPEP_0184679316 /NCGR_PEP_ID=MMETSP0312-20130426/2155_1 /TAXON_ID=31354 /ORGANISM="Compsopogon coeruleus, Strain SAG 36.94" /LENGTH=146 /DNA_ID=CAMNT_0027128687 /DNA_START=426 /DNA_END=866 /DNA_ORIENTATION=-
MTNQVVIVVKPQTFMNNSGTAVRTLLRKFSGKFSIREILVIIDDVALDLGRIRARAKGSAGGHNGLKSIEKCLGTQEYGRLRVGVDPPPGDGRGEYLTKHVLGNFNRSESQRLESSLWAASEMVDAWVQHGNYAEVMKLAPGANQR